MATRNYPRRRRTRHPRVLNHRRSDLSKVSRSQADWPVLAVIGHEPFASRLLNELIQRSCMLHQEVAPILCVGIYSNKAHRPRGGIRFNNDQGLKTIAPGVLRPRTIPGMIDRRPTIDAMLGRSTFLVLLCGKTSCAAGFDPQTSTTHHQADHSPPVTSHFSNSKVNSGLGPSNSISILSARM